MAKYRSTVGQWREGFRRAPILAIAGRISRGTCRGNPHSGIRNDPDPMPSNCEHSLYRQMRATPVNDKLQWHNSLIVTCQKDLVTLSFKPSCCPALSQRRAGTRVNRSVKQSDVRSVPVISNSCSCVFSHSTACTCSLNNPVIIRGIH